jgi:hypothetical protein
MCTVTAAPGPWGGQRPSLAPYFRVTEATSRLTAPRRWYASCGVMSHQALVRASRWSARARARSASAARRSGRLSSALRMSARHISEPELSDDVEARRDVGRPRCGPERDLRRLEGLLGIGGIPLEGEALDLDPE